MEVHFDSPLVIDTPLFSSRNYRIELEASAAAGSRRAFVADKAIVIAIDFLDVAGGKLDGGRKFYNSSKFDNFVYMQGSELPVLRRVDFKAPALAASMRIRILPWSSDFLQLMSAELIELGKDEPEVVVRSMFTYFAPGKERSKEQHDAAPFEAEALETEGFETEEQNVLVLPADIEEKWKLYTPTELERKLDQSAEITQDALWEIYHFLPHDPVSNGAFEYELQQNPKTILVLTDETTRQWAVDVARGGHAVIHVEQNATDSRITVIVPNPTGQTAPRLHVPQSVANARLHQELIEVFRARGVPDFCIAAVGIKALSTPVYLLDRLKIQYAAVLNTEEFPFYSDIPLLLCAQAIAFEDEEKYSAFERSSILKAVLLKVEKSQRPWTPRLEFLQRLLDVVSSSDAPKLIVVAGGKARAPVKRLLLVAYWYPPAGSVAIQRAQYWHENIAKLSRGQIQVHTVTATPSLRPRVNVIWVPDKGIYGRSLPHSIRQRESSLRRSRINTMGLTWEHYLSSFFMKNPQYVYDTVLITGNPFMHFDFADFCASRWRAKTILDFRDPMGHNPRIPHTPSVHAALMALEASFSARADMILTVNEHCRSLMPQPVQHKAVVIRNGYDETLFSGPPASKERADSLIHFGYAGTFYPDADPTELIEALDPSRHRFSYWGRLPKHLGGLRNNSAFSDRGRADYQDLIAALHEVDVGIIVTGGKSFESTTKVYDYIACDLEIVIVTGGEPQTGEIHELTKTLEGVHWVRNNRDDLKKFFKTFKVSPVKRQERQRYSRRASAESLVKLILRRL